jgi:hypothetical protein
MDFKKIRKEEKKKGRKEGRKEGMVGRKESRKEGRKEGREKEGMYINLGLPRSRYQDKIRPAKMCKSKCPVREKEEGSWKRYKSDSCEGEREGRLVG